MQTDSDVCAIVAFVAAIVVRVALVVRRAAVFAVWRAFCSVATQALSHPTVPQQYSLVKHFLF